MKNHPNKPYIKFESNRTTINTSKLVLSDGGGGKTRTRQKTPMRNHPKKPYIKFESNRTTINASKLVPTDGTDRQTYRHTGPRKDSSGPGGTFYVP